MMLFNHKCGTHLKVKSADIYYEDHGSKTAPVLLFLHGALGSIEDLNGILSQLPQDRFRIVGIDSRGHGKSTLGSEDLTYELLQKEVEAVLEHLNIGRLTIIGFSNGGTVAYRLAAFSDLDIEGLITIGAPWSSEHTAHLNEAFAALTSEIWKRECPADYDKYKKLRPEGDFDALFNQALNMALDTTQTRPNDFAEKMRCPLLILRGEHDPVVSQASVDELAEITNDSQVVTIPDAGHEVFEEQLLELMKPIKKFLNVEDAQLASEQY